MEETQKVQSCITKYPWLNQMVKSKQFHKLCDKHIKQKRCHFCCDCMISPLCALCFKKSDHKNHTTIQAYISSHQSGIRTKAISKYMDTSGIHIYSINSHPIVYINQRNDETKRCVRNKGLSKCKICEWEFDSSALFCSIECKFKSALGSNLDDLTEESEESEPVVSKRKRRRKGSPHRSPFY